ncbi:MAG TPA: hypothetical protein V6C81_24300 [Planktothrix sp.]|jgi:hypothetical protein
MQSFDPTSSSGAPPAVTIDLQGVASFAALVELLAKELNTTPGRLVGNLPNGSSFNELVGEIDSVAQGFHRRLTLLARPNSPLTLRLQTSYREGRIQENVLTTTSDFYLNATVESILPQGRALARHIEELFTVMDRMVTLGHTGRLSTNISAAQLEAFESSQGTLVTPSAPNDNR